MDEFYTSHSDSYDVKNVFISLGINDIRYLQHGVLFLRRHLVNLINKIKRYFGSKCNIYFQSVLPTEIEYRHTVRNILDFNKLLYIICAQESCFYIDAFRHFLDTKGNCINRALYRDRVHLNHRGVALLASNYIYLINNKGFNPLGF